MIASDIAYGLAIELETHQARSDPKQTTLVGVDRDATSHRTVCDSRTFTQSDSG